MTPCTGLFSSTPTVAIAPVCENVAVFVRRVTYMPLSPSPSPSRQVLTLDERFRYLSHLLRVRHNVTVVGEW